MKIKNRKLQHVYACRKQTCPAGEVYLLLNATAFKR